jgi:hypothetical protein
MTDEQIAFRKELSDLEDEFGVLVAPPHKIAEWEKIKKAEKLKQAEKSTNKGTS